MIKNIESISIEKLIEYLKRASEPQKSIYAGEIIKRFEPLLRRSWFRGAFHVEYQDFMQDVFVRLFGGLPSLRNSKAFPGYFRRVALSVAANHAKRTTYSNYEKSGEIDQMLKPFDDELLSKLYIRSHIEKLPERERDVINMLYLQDNSASETSKELKITPSAVRATKSRGLKRLREILNSDAKKIENNFR